MTAAVLLGVLDEREHLHTNVLVFLYIQNIFIDRQIDIDIDLDIDIDRQSFAANAPFIMQLVLFFDLRERSLQWTSIDIHRHPSNLDVKQTDFIGPSGRTRSIHRFRPYSFRVKKNTIYQKPAGFEDVSPLFCHTGVKPESWGYPKRSHPSILDWDFPSHKPSSYGGIPMYGTPSYSYKYYLINIPLSHLQMIIPVLSHDDQHKYPINHILEYVISH